MNKEEYEEFLAKIRYVFQHDFLEKAIGEALGKNAVMTILIDVVGQVLILGKHATNSPTAVRDEAMLRQIAKLLEDNMKPMMIQAGKEYRSELQAQDDNGNDGCS